jgi:hypothetical protein
VRKLDVYLITKAEIMKLQQDRLEENISRLVKLSDGSGKPSAGFVDALIHSTLEKLEQPDAEVIPQRQGRFIGINWDKVMGLAAIITLVYSAGFEVLLSGLIRINSFFTFTVLIAMIVNLFVYLGGFIL